MKSAPTINTSRLFIRIVDINDDKAYYKFCSDPLVCKYLTFNPYTSLMQAKKAINNMIRAYLGNTDANFSIILKSTGEVIGSISLTFKENNGAEIGYILSSTYWNNKIMSEALTAIIKVAFEYYELDYLIASYISENISSEKILEKNGFMCYEVLPKSFNKNNIFYDLKKSIKYKM